MLIKEEYVDIDVKCDGKSDVMRVHLYQPVEIGLSCKLPGIVLFSEIYQVTGPVERLGRQLASEGFIVAAPEVYHELLPIGTVLKYDPKDTDKGNECKVAKPCASYDADSAATIDWLLSQKHCNGFIGTIGMCLGGHLSLRAAFHPSVKAGVCLFPTDVHSGTLGLGGDDTLSTLEKLEDAEILFIFGKQDRHVPLEGRKQIKNALEEKDIGFSWMELNARHAFIRDELSKGRYDASLAEVCRVATMELFRRRLVFGMPQQREVDPQSDAPGPAKC